MNSIIAVGLWTGAPGFHGHHCLTYCRHPFVAVCTTSHVLYNCPVVSVSWVVDWSVIGDKVSSSHYKHVHSSAWSSRIQLSAIESSMYYTEIGDPLQNKGQQAKSGTELWHHNTGLHASATALRNHVQVTPDCHNMQHKLTHTHLCMTHLDLVLWNQHSSLAPHAPCPCPVGSCALLQWGNVPPDSDPPGLQSAAWYRSGLSSHGLFLQTEATGTWWPRCAHVL